MNSVNMQVKQQLWVAAVQAPTSTTAVNREAAVSACCNYPLIMDTATPAKKKCTLQTQPSLFEICTQGCKPLSSSVQAQRPSTMDVFGLGVYGSDDEEAKDKASTGAGSDSEDDSDASRSVHHANL
jgi:hypothetical protein